MDFKIVIMSYQKMFNHCLLIFSRFNEHISFIRASFFLTLISLVGSFCNYLYQIYTGRFLGPEEFGLFGSIFALFYLTSVIASMSQIVSARQTSVLVATEKTNLIRFFLKYMIVRTSILAGLVCLIFILLTPVLNSYLHICDQSILYILLFSILVSLIIPVPLGIIQGTEQFFYLGFLQIIQYGSKVILAVILLNLGFGVGGAIAALAIAIMLTLTLGIWIIYKRTKEFEYNTPQSINLSHISSLSAISVIVLLSLSLPGNLDVIIVQHNFPGTTAGLFTSASIVGKIILFFSNAIGLVLFPKVSYLKALGHKTFTYLNLGIIGTTILSGSVVLIIHMQPGIICMLFGGEYYSSYEIYLLYSISMFFFTITTIIAQYCLATDRNRYAFLIAGITFIEYLTVWMGKFDIIQIILILLYSNIILCILSYLYCVKTRNYL